MHKHLSILALLAAVLFTACRSTNTPEQYVDLTISLAGLELETTPIEAPARVAAATAATAATSASATATDASVKRIVLSIYKADGTLFQSYTQDKDAASSTFGQSISTRIPVGSYTFVAVAHNVASTSDAAASITSATEVSLGALAKLDPIYTVSQAVTIAGNTTQAVTVDFGPRKDAVFFVQTTDDTPSNVTKLELIVNPTATDYTDLKVAPATGFATSAWRYKNTLTLAAQQWDTFKDKRPGVSVMLTAASQSVDITINALSSSDEVLYTRTLTSVNLQQGHKTVASGTFFSPSATTSFTFNTSTTEDYISLDN